MLLVYVINVSLSFHLDSSSVWVIIFTSVKLDFNLVFKNTMKKTHSASGKNQIEVLTCFTAGVSIDSSYCVLGRQNL